MEEEIGPPEKKEEGIKQEDLLIEAKNFFEAHKKDLIESKRKGLNVSYINFEDLAKFSKILSDEILENPEETLKTIEQAIEHLSKPEVNNALSKLAGHVFRNDRTDGKTAARVIEAALQEVPEANAA